ALPAQAARELEILEQRLLREAADAAEDGGAREDRLIAVGVPGEAGSEVGERQQRRETGGLLGDRPDPAGAPDHPRIPQRLTHPLRRALREPRVDVQEPEDLARGARRAEVHLDGAAGRRREHRHREAPRARDRSVGAPSVDDQDLVEPPERAELLEALLDPRLLVPRRHDRADPHRRTLSQVARIERSSGVSRVRSCWSASFRQASLSVGYGCSVRARADRPMPWSIARVISAIRSPARGPTTVAPAIRPRASAWIRAKPSVAP